MSELVKKIIFMLIMIATIVGMGYNTLKGVKDYAPTSQSVICYDKDEKGNTYAYYQNPNCSGVYRCDSKGKVEVHKSRYTMDSINKGTIRQIKYLNKNIYIVLEINNRYDIIEFDDMFEYKATYKPGFSKDLDFSDLDYIDKEFYMVMLEDNNTVARAYSFSLETLESYKVANITADAGKHFLYAYYDGKKVEGEYVDGTITNGFERDMTGTPGVPSKTTMISLSNALSYLIKGIIVLAIACLIEAFVYTVAIKRKSYAWRKLLLMITACLLCLAVMVYCFRLVIPERRIEDKDDYIITLLENVDDDLYSASDEYSVLVEAENTQSYAAYIIEVELNGHEFDVYMATEEKAGISAVDLFDNNLLEIVADGSGEVTYRGTSYHVVSHKVSNNFGNEKYILALADVSDVYHDVDASIISFAIAILIPWAIAFIIIGVTYSYEGLELKRIADSMKRICDGKQNDVKKPHTSNKDFDQMWNSLGELAKDIGRNQYDKSQIFKSYYRFAPKNVEKLLDKESISDVLPGDAVRVDGTIGIISMSRPIVKDQNEYLRVANENIDIISKCQSEQGGMILPNNSSLTSLKVLFTEKIQNAVHFGIETASSMDAANESNRQKSLVLLHHTNFMYGIAGTDEQTFACIISMEIDALDKYMAQLAELGTKLIVTETVLSNMEHTLNTRYIGYVELKALGTTIKLYEVLDACGIRERKFKNDTKEIFAKALDLYYRNDFYLARNCFTEALKECPEDLVARWYVFSCEKKLNHPDKDGVKYGLLAD